MTTTRDDESARERLARRAGLIDGLPVAVLGGVTLALGSSGDLTSGLPPGWSS